MSHLASFRADPAIWRRVCCTTLASPRAVFIVGGLAGMVAVTALGISSLRAARREEVPIATPPAA